MELNVNNYYWLKTFPPANSAPHWPKVLAWQKDFVAIYVIYVSYQIGVEGQK